MSVKDLKSNLLLDSIQYFIPGYGHNKISKDLSMCEDAINNIPLHKSTDYYLDRMKILKIAQKKCDCFSVAQALFTIGLLALTGMVTLWFGIGVVIFGLGPVFSTRRSHLYEKEHDATREVHRKFTGYYKRDPRDPGPLHTGPVYYALGAKQPYRVPKKRSRRIKA